MKLKHMHENGGREDGTSETRNREASKNADGYRHSDELKAADPNTAITLSYIRRTINSGRVPVVHVGKKKLVNLDLMLEVLGSGIVAPQGQEDAVSGIRQVD